MRSTSKPDARSLSPILLTQRLGLPGTRTRKTSRFSTLRWDIRLRKNARISWETFGFHIESRVWEFEPSSRLGWFGDGKDVHAYHTFFLTKTPEGCHIVTEEVVKGPGAIHFREQQPNTMHDGHQLWLTSLKDRSEKKLTRNKKDRLLALCPASKLDKKLLVTDAVSVGRCHP